MNKKRTIARIDTDFSEDMKRIAKIRFQNGLAKFKPDELSAREMTRLLRKTNGYRLSLEELKIKPKRK